MKEQEKIEKVKKKLNVKKTIKNAKEKGLIKPLSDAFKNNPVENENHKGNANYFLN